MTKYLTNEFHTNMTKPIKRLPSQILESLYRHKSINKDVADKIEKLFNDLQPNIENKLGYHVA